MTTLRKLQAEIDKTLKSVAVGVELFEQTFEKLGHATNSTSKDKLENDLKSQIKKLQRLRDQIKAWLGSNDIKDKSALMENRRLIELQMERFKALEKEMKMKAFSKEGLMHAEKLDPAEKARREMIDWVGTSIEEIARQVEATEAELESLTAGKKKKKGDERANELEELNERRTWHIGRMEIVQRMLENGSLGTEAVEGIQEDIKYFIESNADEDFDYDTGIYDDLNLMDEEDFTGDFAHADETSLDGASLVDSAEATSALPKTPAKDESAASKKTTPATKPKKKDSTSEDHSAIDDSHHAPPSPVLSKKTVSRKSTIDSTKVELPGKGIVPPVPALPAAAAAAVVTPVKAALPPIRYAAAAAAAVANAATSTAAQVLGGQQESPVKSKVELPSTSPVKQESQANGHAPPPPPGLGRTPSSAPPGASPAPPSLSAQTNTQPLPTVHGSSADIHSPAPGYPAQNQSQPQSQAQAQSQSAAGYASHVQSRTGTPMQSQLSTGQGDSSRSGSVVDFTGRVGSAQPTAQQSQGQGAGAAAAAAAAALASQMQSQPSQAQGLGGNNGTSRVQGQAPIMAGQQQGRAPSRSNHPPGIMGSLMHGFDVTKDQAERRGENAALLHPSLEASFQTAPQQQDGEPPKYYVPRNPVKTPSYYPQNRSQAVYDKAVYEHLDQDSLFFMFYYYTGSYEQWLAARKLKEQNWRFHKQYLTWFKRAHQPQAITDDYEQGGYFYFDWENNWCQRKKSDFRFEYRWLSDQ